MSTHPQWPMYANEDGEYGSAENLYTFEHGDLSDEQWNNVHQLDGIDRFDYIVACVDRDHETQARILGEDE